MTKDRKKRGIIELVNLEDALHAVEIVSFIFKFRIFDFDSPLL